MKCRSALVYIISSVHRAFFPFCVYFVDPTVFVLLGISSLYILFYVTLQSYRQKIIPGNFNKRSFFSSSV